MTKEKKNYQQEVLRYPCAQCGAVIKYAPGTTHQKCEYCGYENHFEQKTGFIQEYDLNAALSKLEEHGGKITRTQIHCDECGAGFQFEENLHAGECPFCGTPIVTATSESKPIQPKSLLPFKIGEAQAIQRFHGWINGLWFAPNAVKKYARSDSKLTGVYLPYWTFDSHTVTDYSGLRGDVYYVEQPVQVMRNNRMVTVIQRVPKIHWTPVSGRVSRFFDDVLVGASKSLPRKILDTLQPWDLEQLVPYDENYISGFRSEFYQIDLGEGFDYARKVMDGVIYRDIAYDIGGDQQMINHVNTRHNHTTYKHCLLPVWTAAFRYRKKVYRFVINARTGKVQGERPFSWWKITLTTFVILSIAAGVIYYLDRSGMLQHGQVESTYYEPYYDSYIR